MALKGLGMPNLQWAPWTAEQERALYDLRPQCLLVLCYDVGIAAQRDQRLVLTEYMEAHPQTRVIYRPYEPDIPRWNPEVWAAECDRRVAFWDWPGEVICDNERNATWEGGGEDWQGHIAWLKRWVAAWRQSSTLPCHLGALAPLGNYRQGWREYQLARLHLLFDVIDVHEYPGCFGDWQVAESLFGRPISITEYNQTDPKAYLAGLGPEVRDASWFILGGTADQQQFWLLGSQYYQAFKEAGMGYVIGEGFKKTESLVGPWQEDEIYHGSGDTRTSLAIGQKGYAVYRARTNRTICVTDSGEMWADDGNQGWVLKKRSPLP